MKDETTAKQQYTEWLVKTGGYARDMTMRDHFAGLAMQSILMDEAISRKWIETIAAASYDMADAMLKERNK